MIFNEIILIRHGETISNSEGRFQGSQDSPLSERGRTQATLLGKYFARHLPRVDYWYVSPYGRARDTSRLIREELDAGDLPAEEVHNELREINCGTFERQLHAEVDQEYLARLRADPSCSYPGDGGESKLDVAARAGIWLRDLKERVRAENRGVPFRALAVAHGNLNQCLGNVILDVDPLLSARSIILNTGISRFIARDIDVDWKLVTWGATPHLEEWQVF